MGNLYIPIRTLLLELGHEPVIPPPCSKRTLDLGAMYAPETACLPLKINIGNYLEAAEAGAEAVIMAGGTGPCRFGFYGQVQREILRDLGIDLEMIVIEPPAAGWQTCLASLARLANGQSWRQILNAVVLTYEKFQCLDRIEAAARQVRPVAKNLKLMEDTFAKALRRLDEAMTIASVRQVTKEGIEDLYSQVSPDKKPRVRVGLVGEIYTVLEPFVNQDIERLLGELGALVDRTVHIGHWVKHHIVLSLFRPFRQRHLIAEANGYLQDAVGGHGLESVAHSVAFARSGRVDGVLHLLPFTCMPEIVAQDILVNVGRDYQIPIISLVLDEQTGEGGYRTRIEAFLDLLERRRQVKEVAAR